MQHLRMAAEREIEMKKLWMSILLLLITSSALAATTGLPFIQDNYPKALADAKERKLPIFVEVWAPW